MSYTNVWSDTAPADSAAANTLGTAIRQLRLDVHERLNTLAGKAPSAALTDPLLSAYNPQRQLCIPVWGMQWSSVIGNLRVPNYTISSAGMSLGLSTEGSVYFWCPLILPVGVTLGAISISVDVTGGTLAYTGQVNEVVSGSNLVTNLCAFAGTGATGNPYSINALGQEGTVTTVGSLYSVSFQIIPSLAVEVIGLTCNYTQPAVNVAF